MSKNAILFATVCTLMLSACGSKTDANEKNFGTALSQYFEKKGELCLDVKRWPVDLTEFDLRQKDTIQTGVANQMAALEAVGLVTGADTDVEGSGFNRGVTYKVKRYDLTDAAKPYVREEEAVQIGLNGAQKATQRDLCWAQKALDKVVKWEGPMKFGDYQEASVTYTYKIKNIADWAKKPEVQAAFIGVKTLIEGASTKESKHGVKLTSQGWEARGLD